MPHRRRFFRHWLTTVETFPEKLSDADLRSWYEKLRHSQDKREASKAIIYGHVRLALSIVAQFAVRAPYSIEDLSSEALEGLTHGTKLLGQGAIDSHGEHPNVTGYLVSTINGRLLRYVSKNGIMRMGQNAYKKMMQEHGEVKQIVLLDGFEHHVKRKTVKGGAEFKELEEAVDTSIREVQNGLRGVRQDLVEMVITLRRQGFCDPQIGQQLNLTRQRIHQIRHMVGQRLLELTT